MLKKKGLISVIAVNWNGKKWLKKYLESIERQTYKNIEVIFVDNASTDDSIAYVKKYFPKVKIIENKNNFGLAKGTKIGIAKSKGEYVLFINNDTWFEKNFIEKLYDFYKKNNYVVVSASEKRYFDNKTFICNTTIDITGSPAFYVPTYSRPDKIFYLTVCFFCKKKDYDDSLGVDENFFMYYEDVDWFWRLTLLGKKFAVAKDIFIHHAGAGSTGNGIKYDFFLWRNQNALQTLIKNYSLITLLIVLPLYVVQNLLEMLFFLIRLKPNISFTYFLGWIFNIKNLKNILKKRKWVQQHRIVSDFEIINRMYWGPAKLKMLLR